MILVLKLSCAVGYYGKDSVYQWMFLGYSIFDFYWRTQDPTLKFIDFVEEIVKLQDMYSLKNIGKETSQVRFQLPKKKNAKVHAVGTGNNFSQELSASPKNKSFMSPPKLRSPPAGQSRKGSLSPNWRERDSKSSYHPDSGSLTLILNTSIDQIGASMNASIDQMGNSISASILDISTVVGKSFEKNNDNVNKQFDSLGSHMDAGFQYITQQLSDIRVVSPERSRRNSGNNYSFSACFGSQSPRQDQTHYRCFYCNEFGHFQAPCPKRSPGRLNRSVTSSQSPSRYQTSGGQKGSNC